MTEPACRGHVPPRDPLRLLNFRFTLSLTVAARLCCILAFPHQEAEPVSPSSEYGPLE